MAKAMDSSKNILAGLLILSFLLLVLVATNWMQKPMNSVNSVKEGDTTKEGFRVAPTRAAECKCLPGYVPSKDITTSNVYSYKERGYTYYIFNPNGYPYTWWIQPENPCGIKHIYKDANLTNKNLGNYPPIDLNNSKFKYIGPLDCYTYKAWTAWLNTPNIISDRYKCQNLEDPSNIKECY
jgi:hypothetical protein